jgi:hypothetical protein
MEELFLHSLSPKGLLKIFIIPSTPTFLFHDRHYRMVSTTAFIKLLSLKKSTRDNGLPRPRDAGWIHCIHLLITGFYGMSVRVSL